MIERPWLAEPTHASELPLMCLDCTNVLAVTRGYCKPCYQRHRKNDTLPLLKTLRPRECRMTDCPNALYARELCRLHYQRWRYRGSADGALPRTEEPGCSTEGCGGVRLARGMCHTHYQLWRRRMLRGASNA